MSSLRERLLRHKKPGGGAGEPPAEMEAGATDSLGEEAAGGREEAVGSTDAGTRNPAESAGASPEPWHAVGAAMAESEWGEFVLRRRTYSAEDKHGSAELGALAGRARMLEALLTEGPWSSGAIAESEAPWHEQFLFLDTETTGLGHGAGNVPFMIGIGFYEGGSFIVEQMLIRHPGEEAAMLGYLQDKLKARPLLISYNGKSFDWPIVRNRYIMNRLKMDQEPEAHLDFLYPSRRLWKHTLPSCRLGLVEEQRLGVRRDGDVPGAMAPVLYFRYLAERDPLVLQGVFLHNELDVLSLAGLAVLFARLLEGSLNWSHIRAYGREEWFRLGLWLEKAGLPGRADEALTALADELLESSGEAENEEGTGDGGAEAPSPLLPLAQYMKRRGRFAEACALWETYIRLKGGQRTASLEPYIELSMYHEHKTKRLDLALLHARQAQDLLWRRGALKRSGSSGRDARRKGAAGAEAETEALEKRVGRLERKAALADAGRRPSPPSRKRRASVTGEESGMTGHKGKGAKQTGAPGGEQLSLRLEETGEGGV
ncbi:MULTISPECIES: ribonuclease H-like domain-containing protein [Paenibacillus]|uniref:ribonuclease H-like domain-containing protein n=1 Tax=Paenibacillus TaxID=44249 RepID=UPI0022B87947|nr:ribonuclease H-like domain-containing protein [Paenibacillus caseinilyticus]MCZ8521501.1 ribonuclease H-like domain-containing protein [Paenibacillus caseinilyticus]